MKCNFYVDSCRSQKIYFLPNRFGLHGDHFLEYSIINFHYVAPWIIQPS